MKTAFIIMVVALFAGNAFAKEVCNGNGTKTSRFASSNPAPTDSSTKSSGSARN